MLAYYSNEFESPNVMTLLCLVTVTNRVWTECGEGILQCPLFWHLKLVSRPMPERAHLSSFMD